MNKTVKADKSTAHTTERPKPAPIGTRTTDSSPDLKIINTNRNGDKK